MQRKILYNKIQELRGNIRVFLRCRKDPSVPCVMKFPSSTEVPKASASASQCPLTTPRQPAPGRQAGGTPHAGGSGDMLTQAQTQTRAPRGRAGRAHPRAMIMRRST